MDSTSSACREAGPPTGREAERRAASARLSEKTVPSCSATENILYSVAFGLASAFENASFVLDEPAIQLKRCRREFFNSSRCKAPGFREMPLDSDDEGGGNFDDFGVKQKGKGLRSAKSGADETLYEHMKPPLPPRPGLGYRLESPLKRTFSKLTDYDDSSDDEEFGYEDMDSSVDRLIATLNGPPEQTRSEEKRSLADVCADDWDSDSDDEDDWRSGSFLATDDFEVVELERNLDDIIAQYHSDKDDRPVNFIDPRVLNTQVSV
jgi:hypothetical protein